MGSAALAAAVALSNDIINPWGGTVGHLGWVEAEQPQEQRYPALPLCAVFSCVQTVVRLPVFGK